MARPWLWPEGVVAVAAVSMVVSFLGPAGNYLVQPNPYPNLNLGPNPNPYLSLSLSLTITCARYDAILPSVWLGASRVAALPFPRAALTATTGFTASLAALGAYYCVCACVCV